MLAWRLVEVILFGLVGAVLDISKLEGSTVGYALLTVLVGGLVKVPISLLFVSVGPFTMREKIYLALCRIPKATVQASLGGVVLALSQAANDAISILVTTPLALVIMTLAPYLLTQTRSLDPTPPLLYSQPRKSRTNRRDSAKARRT